MEQLIEERNKLQEKISKTEKPNNSSNPVIEEINTWEKITIEKVQQTAEYARQQANQLMDSKSMKTTNEFKYFSDELVDLKRTEDYIEQDLTRLKQKIDQFNIDLTQLSQGTRLELNREESERIGWDHIIHVREKPVEVERQQAPTIVAGSARATALFSEMELFCGGRACGRCGKCSDWSFDNNTIDYARRDGRTCNRASFDADLHICNCKYTVKDED
ncbi:unnamed protein product [Adineta steineri]|uniref:Uncharacterized protein n=1 Tax=Adineta steineri TaxID=433720 RepID=A0A814RHP1_9BILA|nr:unnamed protein product [Adineta steineri]CAF3702606.1 unnamed protein product [Adineta steineri]